MIYYTCQFDNICRLIDLLLMNLIYRNCINGKQTTFAFLMSLLRSLVPVCVFLMENNLWNRVIWCLFEVHTYKNYFRQLFLLSIPKENINYAMCISVIMSSTKNVPKVSNFKIYELKLKVCGHKCKFVVKHTNNKMAYHERQQSNNHNLFLLYYNDLV